ncbi:MAG TPA: 50S ribosomal protein L29 [Syntrophorhabdaceae bacterium]|nr:50S ribosomal protein L29 [Syntrophorhabdaceae bacterium]HOL05895.1 50S ribosomal protein L29 [Syntrophorhabdaceae bacterium]HON84664.1 50S ribosomal protein L29 [Syntrophorhabdaceae bacterium]HOT42136.1 50S ribosomal protein L29 [Syntrophorhabdaceae bacterium]HPC67298.1 50S ribosomal protein L29 [Syntrophorhabdaceae bacterium]
MKAKEIKELTVEELLKKKRDIKEEIFNLRFQHSTGQLENTARMRLLKRDIARIETALRQKESKG